MMDRYKALTVLAVVADAGSMRRAARILGMTPSGVSQHIAQLERETRVALLHRSTRRITLTEAGEALAAGGAGVLAAVQDAELRLAALADTPTGELTLSLPTSVAERLVIQALAPVLSAHPLLSLRLVVTDDPIDLLEARIDLAIAIGPHTHAGGIVRPLASWDTIVCASPSYLAQRGRPHVPADLQTHEFLVEERRADRTLDFVRSERQRSVIRGHSRVTTNSARLLTQLAIDGLGLLVTTRMTVAEELADGRLTPILADWRLPPTEVLLVTPTRLTQLAKVRCAVDALVQAFASTASTAATARVRAARARVSSS